jgi:Holliday junction resolvase RusA-like endonuclease
MKWFIPGNVPSSKNGRRWTGKYFVSSKATTKYRKETAKYYDQFRKGFRKQLAKLELPVKISFKFIRGSKHKFDYINPAQTVQDDMVKHNWIDDDNCENILPVFEPYEYDKENPGVEIKLIKNGNKVKKKHSSSSD